MLVVRLRLAFLLGALLFILADCELRSGPANEYQRCNITAPNFVEQNLKTHVKHLVETIGSRNMYTAINFPKLNETVEYILQEMTNAGCTPVLLPYIAHNEWENLNFTVYNIEVSLRGTAPSNTYYVVGAHYDSVPQAPGADDNASGTSALLEIARQLCRRDVSLTNNVRLVAFTNEERYYQNFDMHTGESYGYGSGSTVYATQAKQNHDIIEGMISIESVGYYSNQSGSQQFPTGLGFMEYIYGDKGNFILAVSNFVSRHFMARCVELYPKNAFPMTSIWLPEWLDGNIGRSDHASFWEVDYPAFMLTDTANFRNQHYHRITDTVETLDFYSLARVVLGLSDMLYGLAAATCM